MRRFKPDREWYIPKVSTKIADKLSDAIAYLYQDKSERAMRSRVLRNPS